MNLEFEPLKADEIECKATIIGNRIEISLHSKAHTCTRILNETVGPMNWEKEYTNGNKNCIVRIWDEDKNRMISKEDCGGPLTEVDGQKGQASNGFKRVCALGWGLGIELYTQPEIMLPITDENVICDERKGMIVSERYYVETIVYNDKKQIVRCVITDSNGTVVYDGPNEKGESNVTPPTFNNSTVVIPEDADLQNSDDYINDDLPDNTDGYEDDDSVGGDIVFGRINYRKELEYEMKRTNVKRAGVLNAMKISSFEELDSVSEELLDDVLRKLKAMKTFGN